MEWGKRSVFQNGAFLTHSHGHRKPLVLSNKVKASARLLSRPSDPYRRHSRVDMCVLAIASWSTNKFHNSPKPDSGPGSTHHHTPSVRTCPTICSSPTILSFQSWRFQVRCICYLETWPYLHDLDFQVTKMIFFPL